MATEKKEASKAGVKPPVQTTSTEASDDKAEAANKIIKKYSLYAGGVGFFPVPVLDVVGIGVLQYKMVRELAKEYDIDFSPKVVKTVVSSLLGSVGTKSVAGATGSVLKVVPGIGSLLAGKALSVYAATATYGIGKVFTQHFEKSGSLGDLDLSDMTESFKAFFSKKAPVAA